MMNLLYIDDRCKNEQNIEIYIIKMVLK